MLVNGKELCSSSKEACSLRKALVNKSLGLDVILEEDR